MILWGMVRRGRIWIFVWKIRVIPPPKIVCIGVGIMRSSVEVVKGISLFNGELLRQLTEMTLILMMPLNATHFTNSHLTMQPTRSNTLWQSRLESIYFLKKRINFARSMVKASILCLVPFFIGLTTSLMVIVRHSMLKQLFGLINRFGYEGISGGHVYWYLHWLLQTVVKALNQQPIQNFVMGTFPLEFLKSFLRLIEGYVLLPSGKILTKECLGQRIPSGERVRVGVEKPRLCLFFEGDWKEPQPNGVIRDSIHFWWCHTSLKMAKYVC